VFVVSPYVQAFPIAFTNCEGVSASYHYIGFSNFVMLFHDSVFWVALRHNLCMYTNAFTYGKFGYASAIGVTLFLTNMILTLLTFRLTRRDRVEY
jgi:ABC-type sugar transport system permease subunit